MKRKVSFVTIVILFAAVLILVTVGTSSALADGGYSVNWWTIDNGGGITQSGGDGQYTLSGTIGQWDAGSTTTGGETTLTGGFWAMMTSILDRFLAYLPLIER